MKEKADFYKYVNERMLRTLYLRKIKKSQNESESQSQDGKEDDF